MERLLSRFMIGDRLFFFATSEFLSLSGGQFGIGAFLVLAHFRFAFSLNAAGFFCFFRARRMLTGEPFNPTFFGTAGIISEPNRAAHRSSKRL
jgi:hypothetical protein